MDVHGGVDRRPVFRLHRTAHHPVSDASDPLREVTLEGRADGKIQVIPITGFISDAPKSGVIRTMPSMVQEVVSHLRLAEKDDKVKVVLLKIDTPGGTVTASDILYHEILAFKERTGKKVVVCMMNIATSGGYYVSLPADRIIAHPTTITGSVGVILMRPEVSGLMQKIGVGVQVNKSGENKDMGSPFRPITPMEENMLQDLADTLGKRFVKLVAKHRGLDGERLATVADARVFLADAALKIRLVDKIGYLSDAITEAKQIAGLAADARVVTYRRTEYPDDNLYNTLTSGTRTGPMPLVDMGPIADLARPGCRILLPLAPGDRDALIGIPYPPPIAYVGGGHIELENVLFKKLKWVSETCGFDLTVRAQSSDAWRFIRPGYYLVLFINIIIRRLHSGRVFDGFIDGLVNDLEHFGKTGRRNSPGLDEFDHDLLGRPQNLFVLTCRLSHYRSPCPLLWLNSRVQECIASQPIRVKAFQRGKTTNDQ